MSEQNLKRVKKRGLTKGSRSPKEVEKRLEIGRDILEKYKYKITRGSFKSLYHKALRDCFGEDFEISKSTTDKDMAKLAEECQEKDQYFGWLKKDTAEFSRKLEENKNIPIASDIVKKLIVSVLRSGDTLLDSMIVILKSILLAKVARNFSILCSKTLENLQKNI